MSVDPNFQATFQAGSEAAEKSLCKYCHKPITAEYRGVFPDSEACCECTETGVAAPPSSSLPPVAAAQTYSELCDQLVYTEEGAYDTGCLLTPRSHGQEEFEADVCCYVCKRTKMIPDLWEKLSPAERTPWVKDALVKARAARPQFKMVEGSVELVKGQEPIPAVCYEELPATPTAPAAPHQGTDTSEQPALVGEGTSAGPKKLLRKVPPVAENVENLPAPSFRRRRGSRSEDPAASLTSDDDS